MPEPTSPARLPVWPLIAAAAALVLGLALLRDRAQTLDAAPPLKLTRLDGKVQELKPGTITVVDFWATWCKPCQASMPRVQNVLRDYGPKGVELFSIDTDSEGPDRDPTVREFLMQHQLDFPVALDDGAAQDAFKVNMLPTMLVVGKQGQVAWKHVGVLGAGEEQQLRRILDDALAVK